MNNRLPVDDTQPIHKKRRVMQLVIGEPGDREVIAETEFYMIGKEAIYVNWDKKIREEK